MSKQDSWEFWQFPENRRRMAFIHLGAESFALDLKASCLKNRIQLDNIKAETGAWDNPVSTISFEIAPVSFSLEIDVTEFKNGTFDAITRINIWSDIRGPLNRIYEMVKSGHEFDITLDAKEIKKLFTRMYHDLYNIVKNNQIQNSDLKFLISKVKLPYI